MKKLLLLSLFLLLPFSVEAAICTITGVCDMSSVSDANCAPGGGSNSCGAPAATDTFIVDAGELVISGNWTQTAGARGINLVNGGDLTSQVSSSAITISTGDEGINTISGGLIYKNTGGTLKLRGKYLSHRRNPAVLFDSPDEEFLADGYMHTWQVGDIIPCSTGAGVSNCGTNPYHVEFTYPVGAWDTPSGRTDRNMDTNIAAISAGAGENTDVLCLWDVNVLDNFAHPEDGFCYQIVSKISAPPTYRIVIDVRQGSWATPEGRTHAWRGYHQISLLEAAKAGQYRIRMTETTVVTADQDYAGRYIRCKDSDGNYEPFSYKILATTNDAGGDYVRFAAPDEGGTGLLHDYAAGTVCVVGYGFQKGEPFFIMRPVLVTSSQATPANNTDYLGGYITVAGMDIDLAAVVQYQVRDGLGITSISGAQIQDYWIRDPWGGNTPVMFKFIDLVNLQANRLSITGTAPNSYPGWVDPNPCYNGGGLNPNYRCILHHGMQFYGVSGSSVIGYNARHLGDDAIIMMDFDNPAMTGFWYGYTQSVSASAHPVGIRLQNVHAQYSSIFGASGSLIDWGTSQAQNTLLSNLVCDDCTTRDSEVLAMAAGYDDTPIECGGTASKLVLWAIPGGGIGTGTGGSGLPWADRACYTDLYTNWVDVAATAKYSAAERMNRFAIYNLRHTAGSSAFIYSGVPVWQNGYIAKVSLNKTNPSFVYVQNPDISVIKMKNVGLVDFDTGASATIQGAYLAASGTPSAALVGNEFIGITVGYSNRLPVSVRQNIAIGFNSYTNSGKNLKFGNFHSTGMYASALQVFAVNSGFGAVPNGADIVGPICWTRTAFAGTGTEIGTTQGGQLKDLTTLVYSAAVVSKSIDGPVPASELGELGGCGASATAGIRNQNWALSKSGLSPVTLGGYFSGTGGGGRLMVY